MQQLALGGRLLPHSCASQHVVALLTVSVACRSVDCFDHDRSVSHAHGHCILTTLVPD